MFSKKSKPQPVNRKTEYVSGSTGNQSAAIENYHTKNDRYVLPPPSKLNSNQPVASDADESPRDRHVREREDAHQAARALEYHRRTLSTGRLFSTDM